MSTNVTYDEIVETLVNIVDGSSQEYEDHYIISARLGTKDKDFILSKIEVDEIYNELSGFSVYEDTGLFDDNNFEIVIREESRGPLRRFRENLEIKDAENRIDYEISRLSNAYLVWLIRSMKDSLTPRDYHMFFRRVTNPWDDEIEENRILDYIRANTFTIMTLKIKSERKIGAAEFSRIAYAFLFQVGYNLDVALVPQRSIEEMARRGRIRRMRRAKHEDIDPPRRTYNDDLVQYYLMGLSADNPVIGFISYYQIIENFFESVFNDELIENIKSKITDPGFSYKRKKDVGDLVSHIRKSLKIRSETITFSEMEALKLCLHRFVRIPDLCEKIGDYDEKLLDYYKESRVEFSNGPTVDLQAPDEDVVIKHLAQRIYSTRNALVHSKESDRSRYTPFKDEKILTHEVPLIRFISEMVVISESRVM